MDKLLSVVFWLALVGVGVSFGGSIYTANQEKEDYQKLIGE